MVYNWDKLKFRLAENAAAKSASNDHAKIVKGLIAKHDALHKAAKADRDAARLARGNQQVTRHSGDTCPTCNVGELEQHGGSIHDDGNLKCNNHKCNAEHEIEGENFKTHHSNGKETKEKIAYDKLETTESDAGHRADMHWDISSKLKDAHRALSAMH